MSVDASYSAPQAWVAGPERIYEALSRAALREHGADLSAQRVLDLGSGTGATSAGRRRTRGSTRRPRRILADA